MLKQKFIGLVCVGLLSGCATMDKSECLTADWTTVGFEDGASGKPQSHIGEYRQDCAKHGVSPDLTAYQRGHLQGSKQFCTERNGFLQGRDGQKYRRSCPEQLESQFLSGFRDGQELHGLKQIVHTARVTLNAAIHRLDNIETLIAEKSELMITDGLLRKERLVLLEEIEALKYEYVERDQTIPDLQQQLDYAEQDYAEAEKQFSAYLR